MQEEIQQSNQAVNMAHDFPTIENRIFVLMAAQILPEHTHTQKYRVRVRDLATTEEISGSLYENVSRAVIYLSGKVYGFDYPDRKIFIASHLYKDNILYNYGMGYVEGEFTEKLFPYVQDMSLGHTDFNTKYLLKLRSRYSQRIYLLLQQFKHDGWRVIKVDTLRFLLVLEGRYSRYSNFRARIILESQLELMATDMKFGFEEIKVGRAVDSIKFIFTPVPRPDEIIHLANPKREVVKVIIPPPTGPVLDLNLSEPFRKPAIQESIQLTNQPMKLPDYYYDLFAEKYQIGAMHLIESVYQGEADHPYFDYIIEQVRTKKTVIEKPAGFIFTAIVNGNQRENFQRHQERKQRKQQALPLPASPPEEPGEYRYCSYEKMLERYGVKCREQQAAKQHVPSFAHYVEWVRKEYKIKLQEWDYSNQCMKKDG